MTADPDTTSWNLIAQAADGATSAKTTFALRYGPAIRSWLTARWRTGPLRRQVDDAVQEVFVECFKPGGVLASADAADPRGFRALLHAVTRNVALRIEARAARQRHHLGGDQETLDQHPGAQTSLAHALDRAWAIALVRDAVDEQERLAADHGPTAILRLRLLRLCFHDGLALRSIAQVWDVDPAFVHHQYAKARRDFLRALLAVLARRFPDAPRSELRASCRRSMELLDDGSR